jgi:hypothetical protein
VALLGELHDPFSEVTPSTLCPASELPLEPGVLGGSTMIPKKYADVRSQRKFVSALFGDQEANDPTHTVCGAAKVGSLEFQYWLERWA